jgi:hypothetical protein
MAHSRLQEIDHMSTSLQHRLKAERIYVPTFGQGLHEARPMKVD